MLIKLTWKQFGVLKEAIDIIEAVKGYPKGTAASVGNDLIWDNSGVRIYLKGENDGQKKHNSRD